MSKRVNIITSMCGAGLEREYWLLRDLLIAAGHTVHGMHYTAGPNVEPKEADLNICLEVMMPEAFALAPVTWYAPNSEWYPSMYDQYLPRISKFLCKTKDCLDIWSHKVEPEKCVYTSFIARDLYDPDVPRMNRYLHVAGKSQHKGTEAVIDAWQSDSGFPPLTVIASHPDYKTQVARNAHNITYHARVSDADLRTLMNSHKFHLQPSRYEGFGHILWESVGCGGYLITTNAPPMNTYPVFGLLPVVNAVSQRLAMASSVSAEDIVKMVRNIMWSDIHFGPLNDNEWRERRRQDFARNNEFFTTTFMRMIEEL